MCREADEPGERRNVNKRFDPLHRAPMRSGSNLFRNGWVDVAARAAGQTASLFGWPFLLFLQQPHQVRHACIIFVLGRLRSRLVFPAPSFEPLKDHDHSVD